MKFRTGIIRNKVIFDTSHPRIGQIREWMQEYLNREKLRFSYFVSSMSRQDNPRFGIKYDSDIYYCNYSLDDFNLHNYFVEGDTEETTTLATDYEEGKDFKIYVREDILTDYPLTSRDAVKEIMQKTEEMARKF